MTRLRLQSLLEIMRLVYETHTDCCIENVYRKVVLKKGSHFTLRDVDNTTDGNKFIARFTTGGIENIPKASCLK